MSVTPTQIPVSTSVPALTLAAGTPGGIEVAVSIDPVNDYSMIYTASAAATQGINRNTYLGISSQPLGKTDAQTGISNKTFVAPVLGAATATSINGISLTSESIGFQIAGGTTSKTLTVNNSLAFSGTDSTTMTFPTSSDTVVTIASTQTLTNKTLPSPIIGTSILDTNSNTLIGLTATGSAVNYLNVANSATANAPVISAKGTDTNIGITLTPKGSGTILLNGVSSNNGAGLPTAGTQFTPGTTTSTSYTSTLTSSSAATATVTVGTNGILLIGLWFEGINGTTDITFLSYALSGANTFTPVNDEQAVGINGPTTFAVGSTFLITGLSAGSTVITANFRVTGNTGTYTYHRVWGIPL